MTINSDRIILRPFSSNDVDALYRMSKERDIQKYLNVLTPNKKQLRKIIQAYKKADFVNDFYFVIHEINTNTVIGALIGVTIVPNVMEIMCFLTENKKGQDFMKEAIVAFCIEVDNCLVLKFTISDENICAKKFVEKIGAKYNFKIGNNSVYLLYNNLKELE